MKMSKYLIRLCLLLFIIYEVCYGEIRSGTISSKTGFHYVAKFCYDYTPKPLPNMPDTSTMTLSIILQANPMKVPSGMRLYVYDDQSNSWPAVYGKDISCVQKIAKSRNSTDIRWDEEGRWLMPLARIHEHIRPRFWYIVIANCRGFEDISFEVKFVNQGGSWNDQFGVNEQGLNTLYLVYFVVYAIGVVIHLYALRTMWSEQPIHPIVKLLTSTILLQFASIFCGVIHYATFVEDGVGTPAVNSAGECFNIGARMCFVLLLILIAEGWTISTDAIKNRSQIFATMGMFAAAYVMLLIWDVTGRDPASTLYIYESWPGVLIVILDIATTVWFVVAIYRSHQEENDADKCRLYEMIGFGYTLWFISVPALVVFAATLNPWNREFTVSAVYLTIATIAYAALAALLWPTRADQYFRISTPDIASYDADGL